MTIAHQTATTAPAVRRAPVTFEAPHELVLVEHTNRARTLAKIAGIVALAAFGTALILAIVVGGALFALLNVS